MPVHPFRIYYYLCFLSYTFLGHFTNWSCKEKADRDGCVLRNWDGRRPGVCMGCCCCLLLIHKPRFAASPRRFGAMPPAQLCQRCNQVRPPPLRPQHLLISAAYATRSLRLGNHSRPVLPHNLISPSLPCHFLFARHIAGSKA